MVNQSNAWRRDTIVQTLFFLNGYGNTSNLVQICGHLVKSIVEITLVSAAFTATPFGPQQINKNKARLASLFKGGF